jgi:hypothetical protein
MASRAREFFEKLRAGKDEAAQYDAIEKLANGIYEEEYLEFKAGGKLEDDGVKEMWSQALSGFANSEGGVLVFGIATKPQSPAPGERTIDVSTGVDLVKKPEQLLQLLRDTLLNSTVDRIPGVDYITAREPGGSGKGFVVALIPEGPVKPYRAESSKPKRAFWQRIGDEFAEISYSMLRILFAPRLRSRFEIPMLAGLVFGENKNQGYIEARFLAKIKNTGNTSARDLICTVECNQELIGLPAGTFPLPDGSGGTSLTYGGRIHQQRSLHPGDEIDFFNVVIRYGQFDYSKRTQFTFKFYMTDQEPLYYRAEYNERSIMYNPQMLATPVESL